MARTRQAALDGTLSIVVGASARFYRRIEPLLRCMGSDLTHCGAPGAGQAVKLLNNMVLSVAKGSADSFALRNHGMKALLPGEHPGAARRTLSRRWRSGWAMPTLPRSSKR